MATIKLELERHEVGQILDGLEQRAMAYDYTAAFHRDEPIPEDIVIEEVNDANEAESIAAFYRSIMEKIQKQYKEQGA